MKIKFINKNYIQKSQIFLYPMLGIRRGNSIVPISNYMKWKGEYDLNDFKLICNYHLRDDDEFKFFEEKRLLGNPRFEDMHFLEDGTGAYVFDFSDEIENYHYISKGQYPKLSVDYKTKIIDFFKNNHTHHALALSYVYPDKYYKDFAEILGVNEKLLRDVGSLCSAPDLEKENLTIKKKVITFDTV